MIEPQDSLAPVFEGLKRSRRGRLVMTKAWRVVRWLLIIGVPYASGWVSGKLEMKYRVSRMEEENDAKTAAIKILENRLSDQAKTIELYNLQLEPMKAELRNVGRAVVVARQMAIAFEEPGMRKRKLKAGREVAGAYDRILNAGTTVTGAIEQTTAQIGVP